MRRVIIIALCLYMLCGSAMAEGYDVSSMDYDELAELKETVDREYFSRPEADAMVLRPGYYLVGENIKAGSYYAMMVEPNESDYAPELHVYADKEKFDTRPAGRYGEYMYNDYFHLGDAAKKINLVDGNFLYLQSGSIVISVSDINLTDYYTYEVPEGTFVPVGSYNVGEDIPGGKYIVYPGTIFGGEIKIYHTKEDFHNDGSWHLGYDQHYELDVKQNASSLSISLEDGYVLYVEKDVVMKKQAKLSFDESA